MDMEIFHQMKPIVMSPLEFVMAGVALLVVSLTSLHFIDKYTDEPRKPRIVGNGIKERLCWILVFFVLMVAFIANNGYFVTAISPFKTYPEKFAGIPKLVKAAEKASKEIDTKGLRNFSPDYFGPALGTISEMNASYYQSTIVEIEGMNEWIEFKKEVTDYENFFYSEKIELKKFEEIRTARFANSSCPNDHLWGMNPFEIEMRVNDGLLLMMIPTNFAQFEKYAADMKKEIPNAMHIETGNVSRHLSQLASFNEFVAGSHMEYLMKVKENRLVTKSLEKQHHWSILIVSLFSLVGIVYSGGLIYLVIELIRNRDVDYLNMPIVGTFSRPEVFRRFLELCQETSWCFSCLLAFIFVILCIDNKIAPNCSMGFFNSEDRLHSFYSNDTFKSSDLFRQCAKNRSTTITDLFGQDLLITPEKLVADIIKNIRTDPLDTDFYKEVVHQHGVNVELHRILGEMITVNCSTGAPKEVLESQQQLIQKFINRDSQFRMAVEKLKSMQLQQLLHEVFFAQFEDEFETAAEAINTMIKQNDLKCYAISKLDHRCWLLNCQENSYFDEALIHWVVIAYLFVMISFSTIRIWNLNEQSAEEWEIAMENQPKYFGKNTSNPRYVTNPRH